MALKTSDGQTLDVKEGIVLDAQGQVISGARPQKQTKTKTYSLTTWLFPIGVVAFTAILAFGVFVTGFLFFLILGIAIIKPLLRGLFPKKI